MKKVLAFGEVLWDVFPSGKRLGGAPMNFCAHYAKMGGEAYLYTAVGDDAAGREIIQLAQDLAVAPAYISVSPHHQTGACNITYGRNREPAYELLQNTAYDFIAVTEEFLDGIRSHNFDALHYGTLAQRNVVSRMSFSELIENCEFKERFCDLNLRQNYYNPQLITECLHHASILKLNRFECDAIVDMGLVEKPNASSSFYALGKALCETYKIDCIIITLDQDGALGYLYKEDSYYASKKPLGRVVSTVGAGDGFSACFLYHYLSGANLKDCIEYANVLGDYVVGFEEAIPPYSEELLQKIKKK